MHSHLNVVCRKHAFDALELTLPPVICAVGFLQDLDLVALFEHQIAVALASKVIEGSDELEVVRRYPGRRGRRLLLS